MVGILFRTKHLRSWGLALLAAAACVAAIVACGGDGAPKLQLRFEADPNTLPPGDAPRFMGVMARILERRATAYGIAGAKVEVRGENALEVTLPASISHADAVRLLGQTALLQIRQPAQDDSGAILCKAPDGSQVSVAPEDMTYAAPAPGDRTLPRCAAGGVIADIIWKGFEQGGSAAAGLGKIMEVSAARVDMSGEPVVVIALTTASSADLQDFSGLVVGLPIGIFLDGELLAGPTVTEPLTSGTLSVGGLNLPDALMVAAQLSGGKLPTRLTEAARE